MSTLEEQIAQLEAAIAAQEALRPTIGDAMVEVTTAALRAQLDALRAQQQPEGSTADIMASDQLLERLQNYLPQGLAEKMRATGHIEGERRQVTVLFADIAGFTALSERLDPEDVSVLSNSVLKELAEAVYQYEGYVDKFLGDAVMAVFGAPVAHEDDPERALRTALDMRERLERFNRLNIDRLGQPLALHVGVNTGTVVAGNVGSDYRMSYTVMGDTVNTASRLQNAALPGQILVSRDTYRLARGAFTFLALEPIRVKGKRDLLDVFELHQTKVAPGKARGLREFAPVFVGRGAEMAQLQAVATDLQAGRGHIIAISGEAGIGKSRLVAEWQREIGDRVTWVEGRCLAYKSQVPYGPFLDMFVRLAGITPESTEDMARWRLDLFVERFFPDSLEAKSIFANLLLLPLAQNERDLLASLAPKQVRQRLFDLTTALITQLAEEQPVVLVMEDMHWADAASLELFEHLFSLAEQLPVALVSISREPPAEAMRARYEDKLVAIHLTALAEDTSCEMVAKLLEIQELSPTLQRVTTDKAEGNPFFVEELIRTLIERGALAQTQDDRWEVTPLLGTITVPDTLNGLLMARLDRLPPKTRWLAQQAAVLGRFFLYRALRQMVETTAGMDDDLSQMEHDDLIRERARDPELEYMFRHALTQEVAYQSLLGTRRKELHRKAAEALEAAFSDRLDEQIPIIAEHYDRAEEWGKAHAYHAQAGDRAAGLYAYAEARHHYGKALDAIIQSDETPDNNRRHADTVINLTLVSDRAIPPEEQLTRLTEAQRRLQVMSESGHPEPGRLARVHYWTGRIQALRGAQREAAEHFQRILSLASEQELGDPELLVIPSYSLGMLTFLQGRLGQAAEMLSNVIAPFERAESWSEWVVAVAHRSICLAGMGDYAAAVAEAQRALARAQEMNAPTSIGVAYGALGTVQVLGGDLAAAEETGRKIVEVASGAGDWLLVWYGNFLQSWAQSREGQFGPAAASMAQSQAAAKEFGGRVQRADWAAAVQAAIAMGAGRNEEAITAAQQSVNIGQQFGAVMGPGMARRVWGQALAAQTPPRWDEAEEQMAESLRLLESGQDRLEAARTQVAWGTVCRDRGNYAGARAHWEKSLVQWETSGIAGELANVQSLMAGLPAA
jgi:class 3 adenylate cyclase/tetratricopeptide (TPR) repeat protein